MKSMAWLYSPHQWICIGIALIFLLAANSGVAYADMKIERDILYDKNSGQKLDIYYPAGDQGHPVLIFYYGGGWRGGKRQDYTLVADYFTRAGYIVVIPDYRKYPEVTYPRFIEDCAAALAWVHNHIHHTPVFLMGHSAGAYNAVMLATDPRSLATYGMQPSSSIAGVIGLAGPYGFTPQSPKYRDIFNHMKNYDAMKVAAYVTGKEPQMLLLHGGQDDTVSAENSYVLANVLQASGAQAQVKIYPTLGHAAIIGALANREEKDAPVAADALAFMNAIRHNKR